MAEERLAGAGAGFAEQLRGRGEVAQQSDEGCYVAGLDLPAAAVAFDDRAGVASGGPM